MCITELAKSLVSFSAANPPNSTIHFLTETSIRKLMREGRKSVSEGTLGLLLVLVRRLVCAKAYVSSFLTLVPYCTALLPLLLLLALLLLSGEIFFHEHCWSKSPLITLARIIRVKILQHLFGVFDFFRITKFSTRTTEPLESTQERTNALTMTT